MIELLEVILPCSRRQKVRFYFWVDNDRNPVAEYLLGLEDQQKEKVIGFLVAIAMDGIPRHNEQLYKKVHGFENQYELKRKPHRLIYHENGSGEALVLTEAWKKQETSKKNDPHYKAADALWQAYLKQQKTGA